MNILGINNANGFTSRYRRDTFRDREDFDKTKDKITKGYSTYDGYDETNSDFTNDESDFDKETFNDKLLKKEFADYGRDYFLQPMSAFSMDVDKNSDIVEMSILKTKSGEMFSGNLYNHLMQKAETISPEDLESVADNAKLIKNDLNEYVDYDMLEAGFVIKEKFPELSDERFINYMQSLVSVDKRGNEVCDKSVAKKFRHMNSAGVRTEVLGRRFD